ncbi:MAG: hypothetical protein M1457_10895, partial [bacterium]|nr:hypothetical protein [bacterium]
GLAIRGNTIEKTDTYPAWRTAQAPFVIEGSGRVEIAGNRFTAGAPEPLADLDEQTVRAAKVSG